MLIRDIGRVELVADERRGLTELNGEARWCRASPWPVTARTPFEVIANLKEKVAEIGAGLPTGVTIETVYDRSN